MGVQGNAYETQMIKKIIMMLLNQTYNSILKFYLLYNINVMPWLLKGPVRDGQKILYLNTSAGYHIMQQN